MTKTPSPRASLTRALITCLFLLAMTARTRAESATHSSQPQAIRLQLKWSHQFQFAGYYAALHKGFYRQAGLTVTLTEGAPERIPEEEVISGHAEYGISGPSVLLARSRGLPVVVLAAIFQHSPSILIIRQNSGITSPQDLPGRTIYASKAEQAEIFAICSNEGIPPSKLLINSSTWDLNDLVNGKADAFAGYSTNEPFLLAQLNVPIITIRPQVYGIDFYGDCLFCSEQEVTEHPARAAAFRAASLRGWDYAMKHVEEIITLIQTQYRPDKSAAHLRFEAEAMRKLMLPEVIEIGHMNPGRWHHIASTYMAAGALPKDFQFGSFLYTPLINGELNWLRPLLLSLLAFLTLAGLGIGTLVFFNRKLHITVESRTQSLVEREQAFRSIFNHSPYAIFILKADTLEYVDVNRRFEEITGTNRDVFLADPNADQRFLALPQQKALLIDKFKAQGYLEDEEITTIRVGGARGTLLRSSSLIRLTNQRVVLSVLKDITQVKEAQQAQQKSEEDLRITLNSIGDAVIATDREGRITRMNPVAEGLTGWTVTAAIGKPLPCIFNIIDANTRQACTNPALDALDVSRGLELGREILLLSRDGKEYNISDSAAPIRDAEEQVVGAVLVFRNVTEQYRLEEQFRQSQKMESIGQLASGIAHDFNNTLSGIIGGAELIMLKQSDEQKASFQKYLDMILDSAEQATVLNRKLLGFSRKAKMCSTPFSVHANIENALAILERSIDPRIRISYNFTASPDTVVGDPSLLQNAILNICINARDAMPEGGGLTLGTTVLTLNTKECKTSPFNIAPGPYLRLTIADTGTGMTQETMSRIFEPFYTTKSQGKGTGLGMAAVYSTVKNHRGAISIDTALGEGTEFIIDLPLTYADIGPAPSDIHGAVRGSGTILLIDDEDAIRNTTSFMLRELGYQTLTAENGEIGVNLYRQRGDEIDLVLLDMVMPVLNGRDTFTALKRIDPDVKIIISSGFTREAGLDDLFEEGLIAFVQKPFRHSVLSRAISEALRDKQPQLAKVDSRQTAKPNASPPKCKPSHSHTTQHSSRKERRALIAEADQATRTLLAEVLTGQGYQVTTAISGCQVEAALRTTDHCLQLLSWDLPGLSGVDLCERVRSKADNSYLLVLTSGDNSETLNQALTAGADDILQKPFPIDHLSLRLGAAEQCIARRQKAAKQRAALEERLELLENRLAKSRWHEHH